MSDYVYSEQVLESFYSRYTASCFCIGDVLTFDKNILKCDAFNHLQPELKQKLAAMVEAQLAGDAVICVQDVSLSPLTSNQYDASTITIAYSQGGGRYFDPITIPGLMGEFISVIDGGANVVSTIPASAKLNYNDKNQFKMYTLNLGDMKKLNDRPSIPVTQ